MGHPSTGVVGRASRVPERAWAARHCSLLMGTARDRLLKACIRTQRTYFHTGKGPLAVPWTRICPHPHGAAIFRRRPPDRRRPFWRDRRGYQGIRPPGEPFQGRLSGAPACRQRRWGGISGSITDNTARSPLLIGPVSVSLFGKCEALGGNEVLGGGEPPRSAHRQRHLTERGIKEEKTRGSTAAGCSPPVVTRT